MKRIAIVVDRADSGLGIAANGRAEFDSSIEVINALSFYSPHKLLKRLEAEEFSDVLFSWRYLLEEIFGDSKLESHISKLRTSMKLGILIPDYQGLERDGLRLNAREKSLLSKVDYFHVTNLDLQKRYLDSDYCEKFAGVLHDLTATSELLSVRKLNLVRQRRILWIGNSGWGSRAGYIDYKGYKRVVEPISKYFEANTNLYEVEIVDLAHQKIPHKNVLKKIASSEILLVASDFEGTALPILEAIGLGTYVISTNVGIAPEILGDDRVGIVLNQSSDDFLTAILNFDQRNKDQVAYKVFDDYVSLSSREIVGIHTLANLPEQFRHESTKTNLVIRLKWFLRYLKHLH
jgi:hypothetical protein